MALGLAVASATLAGCGSVSTSSALAQWSHQSNFEQSVTILLDDARHAAKALRATSSLNDLHTVCAVLLVDVQSANAALPTPDSQTTTLLSSAYSDLGAGANRCYVADSAPRRQRALSDLTTGASLLVEARTRVRNS
ncbi:MAG TPA: hypothetical protein VLS91_06480 [Acidimicrobiales bacterium]|nr:hypothetical protein [Acidimicrobiales bacterium]